jgi:hypothetical protein
VVRVGESSDSRSSMRKRFCATLNARGCPSAAGRTSLSTSTSRCGAQAAGRRCQRPAQPWLVALRDPVCTPSAAAITSTSLGACPLLLVSAHCATRGLLSPPQPTRTCGLSRYSQGDPLNSAFPARHQPGHQVRTACLSRPTHTHRHVRPPAPQCGHGAARRGSTCSVTTRRRLLKSRFTNALLRVTPSLVHIIIMLFAGASLVLHAASTASPPPLASPLPWPLPPAASPPSAARAAGGSLRLEPLRARSCLASSSAPPPPPASPPPAPLSVPLYAWDGSKLRHCAAA